MFRKRGCWRLQEYKILVNVIFQGNIGKEKHATQIFELVTGLPYSGINRISSLMGLKGGHYFAHFTFDKTEVWGSCVILPANMASKQGKLIQVHLTSKLLPVWYSYITEALHSKGSHKQNDKTTQRMGESFCKWSKLQGTTLHSIQRAHAALCEKETQSEDLNRYFSKEDI